MKMAVVILNWNGKHLLERFLPSVILHSQEATVYVADNASNDGSVEFLKSKFPQIKIIQNSENGGYAKGYNDALKQVNEPLLCLLNNDIEVTANWLNPILDEFKNDEISIIQPKILDHNNKNFFEYAGAAGGFIDQLGYPFCRGRIFETLEKDNGQYDEPIDILWASGACFFIKKKCFEQLDGFDESFFAHMEEIDLCWRAHNLGKTIRCIPDSIVYHVGGATLAKSNSKKVFLNFRNSLFTLVKNAHKPVGILIFKRLLLDGVAGLKFLLQGQPKSLMAVLKAHLHFYRRLPTLLRSRKKLTQKDDYYRINSIIISYYLKSKKTFDCL